MKPMKQQLQLLEVISQIEPIDRAIGEQVSQYVDTLTKPPGSLGRLEQLAIEIAAMTGQPFPTITPPAVIIFAADHGIVQEGVSAYPQEVTAQMVYNFLQGGAAINVFARQIGASFYIVDMGVAQDLVAEGIITRKIRYGTGNFLLEPAMTRAEAIQSIEIGMEIAEQRIQEGAKCLILGEMGIGNTTASSAMLASFCPGELQAIVGPGTGITLEQLQHKTHIIDQALKNRRPNSQDPLDVLAQVGGLEIGAMTGAMLMAARLKTPILVDGFISTIAAILAAQLAPVAKDYMIVGHRSQEPGHQLALNLLGKEPILDLNLRLGEGSGAAISFPILEAAINMLNLMATFSSAGISTKER